MTKHYLLSAALLLTNKAAAFSAHHRVLVPSFLPQLDTISRARVYARTSTALSLSTAASPSALCRIQESDLTALSRDGYVVIPNFLTEDIAASVREDVSDLRKGGKFKVAKIGQDSTNQLAEDIRVAETCFIGRDKVSELGENGGRAQLYDMLDNLRNDLSANPRLAGGALTDVPPVLDANLSELLYAYYPRGGFYRRHRDAIPGSASVLRCYSLLLYLNEDWTEGDGGQLRIHRDGGGDFVPEGVSPDFVDIEPRSGTLVLFKSDLVPHEVLDTQAERMAVVGWFNRAVTAADLGNLSSGGDQIRVVMLAVAAALVTAGVVSILQGG